VSTRLEVLDQIGIVVEDIQETVKHYWNILGIGPWSLYTAKPPSLSRTEVHGKPAYYSMKLAFAKIGSLTLELIQPLEGESVYKEFLARKGAGIHHIASYQVKDVTGTIADMQDKGIGVLQSGQWEGAFFAYLDTEKMLGAVIELIKRSRDRPKPESTYP
jgi:methylmalonyl-CoA/ethylmalonyl-CoA epimerase